MMGKDASQSIHCPSCGTAEKPQSSWYRIRRGGHCHPEYHLAGTRYMTKLRCLKTCSVHCILGSLLMSLILLTGCDQKNTGVSGTDVVTKTALTQAIDFTLPDLAGNPHSMNEYLQKGPVMLVFFTSWCPFCKKEIPALKQAYQDYGAKGLQLIAINAGLADSLENAQHYALQHKLPYVVLYDRDGITAGDYGVRAVPKIIYIQQDGKIISTSQYVDREVIGGLLRLRQ